MWQGWQHCALTLLPTFQPQGVYSGAQNRSHTSPTDGSYGVMPLLCLRAPPSLNVGFHYIPMLCETG
ncbi:hypothetical protein E2C01_072531 [Portunus trituberculatus]|uniref:Uncharacterized protein n=1 Tax=Portunus trituberculatus TaxID=210409 RepID=A0A5B7I972_PORTR|nr:hypothetical protein [Portunus trituberculatus]